MVLRAQDEHYEKTGGLDASMLVLSDLGRIEEQRFVGFAETDWSGGITVDVKARRSGCASRKLEEGRLSYRTS